MLKSVQWFKNPNNYDTQAARDTLDQLQAEIPSCNNLMIDMWLDTDSNDNVTPRMSMVSDYEAALQAAKAKGYTILVRLYNNPRFWEPEEWYPTDIPLWINNYGEAIKVWGALAEQYGAEFMFIANEAHGIEHYSAEWAAAVAKLRSVYSGKIGYNTSWFNNLTEFEEQKNDRAWYADLDFLGISAYNYVCTINQPTVTYLVQNWHDSIYPAYPGRDVVDMFREWAEHHNKMVVLVPGVQSGLGACKKPYLYQDNLAVNVEEQRAWYEAIFEAFKDQPWVLGYTWDGAWRTANLAGDNQFHVMNKPATGVLESWYSSMVEEDMSVEYENKKNEIQTLQIGKDEVVTTFVVRETVIVDIGEKKRLTYLPGERIRGVESQ